MSQQKHMQQTQAQQKHDIDAGIEQHSPGRDEPHREHEPEDRGGTYAREHREYQKPVHPKRYPRPEVEREVLPPSDPDDPAAT